MATVTAPQFAPLFQPERLRTFPQEKSAYRLVITYVLLFPLLFFAVRGAFSFQYAGTNNAATGTYGAMVNPDAGNGSALHSIELALCYGIICLACVPVWRRVLASCMDNKIAFALPLWAILSTIWSQEPKRTLVFAVFALIHTIFALYLPARFKPQQQLQIFVLLCVIAAVSSFLVIGLMPRAGIDHKNATIGLEGIFPHKNICSVAMLSFMLAGCFYRFKGKSALFRKLLFYFMALALVIGSTSRTGWLVFICSMVFIFLIKYLRNVNQLERFLVALFIPTAMALAMWVVFEYRNEILALLGKSSNLNGRTVIWRAVFLSIVKRPITGFGYDAFWIGFKGEAVRLATASGITGLSNAENGILQLWLELGLVGVLILLSMLFRSCKNAVTCFRSDTQGYTLWYMSILFLNLLALVDGDKFMFPHSIAWTMFVLADAGLALQAKRIQQVLPPR